MAFNELLAQVVELLQRQGRVSYGALKRRFALDDEYLQDLRDELITAQRLAADEDGKVLVWVGEKGNGEAEYRGSGEREIASALFTIVSPQPLIPNPQPPSAERRQ